MRVAGADVRRLVLTASGVAAFVLAGCATAPGEPLVRPPGYQLVWADEFETPGLPDPARWTHETQRNRDDSIGVHAHGETDPLKGGAS